MPLKSEIKSIILQEIEHVFGRRIVSSRDCIELSEDVFRKTKVQLNPNTLRRFFCIVKAEYPPSQATLMILSKYCGFQNMDDIYKIRKKEKHEKSIIKPESMLHYFLSMFQDSVVKDSNDETFLQLVVHSIKFLNGHKFLTDKFQSQIAKTKNGTNYYFEQLVNVDQFNSFYGEGLRYYLREKGTVEAELFTSSINVMKYWLNGDDTQLVSHAAQMISCEPAEPVHPYLSARHMAGLLYYYHVNKHDSENLRISISNFITDLDADPENKHCGYLATYMLAEALMLTGHSGDALFYIEQRRKKQADPAQPPMLNYTQNFNLLESYALLNVGNHRQAEKKFNEIKSSEFPFLNQKFSSILYLSLLQKLKPRDTKHQEQFRSLIVETGFERLYDFQPGKAVGKAM